MPRWKTHLNSGKNIISWAQTLIAFAKINKILKCSGTVLLALYTHTVQTNPALFLLGGWDPTKGAYAFFNYTKPNYFPRRAFFLNSFRKGITLFSYKWHTHVLLTWHYLLTLALKVKRKYFITLLWILRFKPVFYNITTLTFHPLFSTDIFRRHNFCFVMKLHIVNIC